MLRNFKQDDKFSCYGGQMIESPSPIYNLYRASQLRFPGEEILEEANKFAYEFLQEKLAQNKILDKWVISKHLHDEVIYPLFVLFRMFFFYLKRRIHITYYITF